MEITWQETSPHRDRGWETDYPRVGSGSWDLGFVNHAANGSIPARVWLANNAQMLQDVTTCPKWDRGWVRYQPSGQILRISGTQVSGRIVQG